MTAPRVKICGLTRRADAESAARAGAWFGGVVLAPGGPRSIEPERAAALFAGVPLRRVGVFVNADPAEVVRTAEVAGLDVLQLHGDETPEQVRLLRGAGSWSVWKAVRPRSAADFSRSAERYAPVVDGLLLDGWSAGARGGTGARFPWEEVAPHRHLLPAHVALIVAGGLQAGSVAHAVRLLAPAVVDVSSGVESAPGIKDPRAVAAFVAAAHGAGAQAGAME